MKKVSIHGAITKPERGEDKVKYNVYNHELSVGNISVSNVTGSSLFMIGDSHIVELQSLFDTPPESYIVLSEKKSRQVGNQDGTTSD